MRLPADDAWNRIVEAYKSGSYESCVSHLQFAGSSAARLLKARSLLRLGLGADALTALAGIDEIESDAESLGERDSLASVALTHLGRFAEAKLAQAIAREHLSTVTAWAVRSELRFHETILNFAIGDFQKVYDASLEADRDILTYYERTSHDVISVTSSRAALRSSAAIVDVSRGRYSQALDGFDKALEICNADPNSTVGDRARLLLNITGIMNDSGDDQANTLQLVLNATKGISWTDELARTQFYVYRAIGSAFALLGDYSKAFETIVEAEACAPTTLERLLARIDRLQLRKELGNHETAASDLRAIDRDALVILDFHFVENDAIALLLLGKQLAEVNVSMARSLQESYATVKSHKVRLSTAFSDGRFDAYSLRLDAAIASAYGDSKSSDSLNRQAFTLFERLGDRFSAARVALELGKATNGKPYCDYMCEAALRRPRSSLAVAAARQYPQFRRTIALARRRESRAKEDFGTSSLTGKTDRDRV